MIKPIIFKIDSLEENGFNCYIKGRSYDLQENGMEYSAEDAVKFYKKGFYYYQDRMCQYSIAISNYLGDFDYLFDDVDKQIPFPSTYEIETLAGDEDEIKSTYAKFILAAYYNYGLSGVKIDDEKAYEIIYECAQNGHVGAMYDLGAKEKFIRKTPNSFKYLDLAAKSGSIRAREELLKVKKKKKLNNPCKLNN